MLSLNTSLLGIPEFTTVHPASTPKVPHAKPWWLRQERICLQCRRAGFDPWVGKIPWSRKRLQLQYSCLENPMDRGVWQAKVHGVAKG